MYDAARVKGHVDICMKRYDGRTKPTPKPRINMKQKGKKVPVSIFLVAKLLYKYYCLSVCPLSVRFRGKLDFL